jgi:hypothetical protein
MIRAEEELASGTMYVVIYTNDSNRPAYHIHALDLGSLTDEPGGLEYGAECFRHH